LFDARAFFRPLQDYWRIINVADTPTASRRRPLSDRWATQTIQSVNRDPKAVPGKEGRDLAAGKTFAGRDCVHGLLIFAGFRHQEAGE
jgi:hypothetical protein